MSFINLTTLSDHRRQEMAERIHMFVKKCDYAVQNIEKLKYQARGFISQLNCDPLELKDQFLACVKKLEEYSYLISDFNLALENYIESGTHASASVFDMTCKVLQPTLSFNLMDTLPGPVPSTSKTLNRPRYRSKKKKVPKKEQLLISFSSGSSEESIPMAMAQKCMITETINNVQLDDEEINAKLPGQEVLQVDCEYMAVILYADGLAFWVTTDVIEDAFQMGALMTEYYKHNKVQLSLDQVMSLGYCAVYDDSDSYSRALFIQLNKDDMTLAQVYLVDYGETIFVPTCWLQPLMPQFCRKPPYARCCHLAGVEIDCDNTQVVKRVENLIRTYMGKNCKIYIDDNSSESLGVYVILEDGLKLNDLINAEGLCEKIVDESTATELSNEFPGLTAENCDITQIPEHDDLVIAVTGYHNRDEADICKHYKGGERTCFKGNRCSKRHVVKHPDGWTLDRISVPVKLKPLQLPQVGTFLRVTVPHVPHFDHFYVQIIDTEDNPELGGVVPPTSLSSLVLSMNCSTTKAAYKPLPMIPAPGELVASVYPLDGKWYRATVLSSTRSDQSVEIKYVDYGNVMWVQEDTLRELDARFLMLPPQAILCTLAGVVVRNPTSGSHKAARKTLEALLQDNRFDAEVIAVDYDKLTVALYDENGSNVADLLAAQKVVERQEISGTVRQNYIVIP